MKKEPHSRLPACQVLFIFRLLFFCDVRSLKFGTHDLSEFFIRMKITKCFFKKWGKAKNWKQALIENDVRDYRLTENQTLQTYPILEMEMKEKIQCDFGHFQRTCGSRPFQKLIILKLISKSSSSFIFSF